MIQIELSPEMEERLADAARARGLQPDDYASQIIASSVRLTEQKQPSAEDLERFFVALATHSTKIPDLPDEAYSRESIYQDHS